MRLRIKKFRHFTSSFIAVFIYITNDTESQYSRLQIISRLNVRPTEVSDSSAGVCSGAPSFDTETVEPSTLPWDGGRL